MDHVERFRAVMSFQPTDRLPRWEWAMWWDETIARWKTAGLPAGLSSVFQISGYFGILIPALLTCLSWFATSPPVVRAEESTPQGGRVPAIVGEAPLAKDFVTPPDSARPWVYWFFMDGNLSREGISADLEAMKRAGIGGAIILEVGIGIPRGPVEFMSGPWRELLKHAVSEADRLGLEIALGAGPGWCGTGGPWIKPEQSMQHLVASETTVSGPVKYAAVLPRPRPRTPFFGEGTLTPELAKQWREFYRDVAVVAFATPGGNSRIADIDEKALYYRAPFSSQPGVKPFLPAPADYPRLPVDQCISSQAIVDLTAELGPDGRLVWEVPAGDWTIMRFARTTTGQTTRPAPAPGLGFESDKFDKAALDAHFEAFIETLLKTVGEPNSPGRGLTALHFDSWEMSSQNWSESFRQEFTRRRGYDLLRYLPVMTGRVVDSQDLSERFLWDLRQTAQELVVENHALRLKELAGRHGLKLSIEPYDLNPCADLKLGGAADVPMCEFWSQGYGFPTEFSCLEAVSIAHTLGRRVVAAESFTALPEEQWRQYPGAMKAQGDWALCTGINRFVFHRYQHQPRLDQWPGMTMGPYGVHWERTQTWWDMVPAYHIYLTRCQQMLRRGLPVADVLYLAPEGAPHVFRPPASAMQGAPPDRRGYNFDGCDPDVLIARASVNNGRIVLPDGMSYRLLVMPRFETMTPGLLRKIRDLVEAGATVVGAPPRKSPSLADYPQCDQQVKQLAAELWGEGSPVAGRSVGKGRVIYDGGMSRPPAARDIYPDYRMTAQVLSQMGVPPDFEAEGVRYVHRRETGTDWYFIANREDHARTTTCRFRVGGLKPEWWSPVSGECRELPEYEQQDGCTAVSVRLEAFESGFVVFRKPAAKPATSGKNCPELNTIATLSAPWEVAFVPQWGGPAKIVMAKLEDWSKRSEAGIRYYSGKAVYRTTFAAGDAALHRPDVRLYLSLGNVKNLASVRLNGRDLGILWCQPWQVEIPPAILRAENNTLEITVANLWINRLIGDSALPEGKRLTRTTWNPFNANSPLQESGLLGPVTLCTTERTTGIDAAAAEAQQPAVKRLADEVRDKGWIVFSARAEQGNWDLFLCRPDGSALRNITRTSEYHEAAPQFSRDGRKLLYRRLPRKETIDGNHYGTQGELVFANSDGTDAKVYGKSGEYPWASWSPDGKQIACLEIKGVFLVDVATKQVVRRLERKGFFQQLTWSPDGRWLGGVANSYGTGWSIARMDAASGATSAVSRVDCCTPDWFPDSRSLIFSNRPAGQKSNQGYGWTQLWSSDAEGKTRRLLYGEDGRHVYGGHVSADGKYVLFTGNVQEDGDPGRAGGPMGLMRLADAPIVAGESQQLRTAHPGAKSGPVLVLPAGWEPCWTFAEIAATADDPDDAAVLAAEVRRKGWIVFSAATERGDWDLFVMRPDGSDRRAITETPAYNEAGARFSPSGQRLLYFRMSKTEAVDNNTYGTHELVVANADGSQPAVYGTGFPWAAWGSDGRQLACLAKGGIEIIDLESRKSVRRLPRKGMVQQLAWSPDGKWFAGTANGLGPYWNIGRLDADTGQLNAVSATDRYNCTPDWLPDSRQIVYSRGIIPSAGGWAELWIADGDGQRQRLVYAEEGRHIYGGNVSPDGNYVLFTRSQLDLGKVDNSRTRMALIRWADAPMVGGQGISLRQRHPGARHGPLLDLSWGWEPHWTYAEIPPPPEPTASPTSNDPPRERQR